ncbi:NAD(P)H-hydrate dehydratase, partial [Methylobacterium gnaphalii]
ALVLGGSVSVPGAALLAGIAALRAGAGKLKIATVGSVAAGMGLAVPEAMVIGLAETPEGGVDAEGAVECLLKVTKGCDALLVGPGLVEDGPTTTLAIRLLEALPSASFILDAAAVCGLASYSDDVRRHGSRVVITPHAGEMAQLLDRSRDDVEADPLDAALRAVELLGTVVVMKGAKTWIVDPEGARWLYEGGGVGLATSGSGDALAGIILGLLARGVAPMAAALWGVFLHGEAGKSLAASVGPIGFLARELSGEVPGLLRKAAAQP